MKTLLIPLLAALVGCSTFRDPSANRDDLRECAVTAKAEARANTSAIDFLLFGAAGRRLRQRDSFENCMAGKGYRTASTLR